MWKYGLVIIILIFLLENCATPGSPDGGPRDETPPQIDSAFSTPNYQTNFQKQTIEITFDEWVKLSNPTTQVLISPPFTGGDRPKISLKKRTVRFEFPEEDLKPNTTYTINFGDAVQDLTESNPAPDLRYVFSTGDEIDSLEISGNIVDVLTGEPVPDVFMLLYLNHADTVVRKELPFYFAKTDKEGSFTISNLPTAVFKGFALEDVDANFKFNAINERIGFLDSLIVLNDSSNINLTIQLFEETAPPDLKKDESDQYGLIKLRFNRPPHEVEVDIQETGLRTFIERELDTLKIWYDGVANENWKVFLQDSLDWKDTIKVELFSKEEFVENRKVKFLKLETGGKTKELLPDKSIRLSFNHPLQSVDTAKFFLLEDSTEIRVVPTVTIDSVNRKELLITYPWAGTKIYKLEILPEGITDWFGLTSDTIRNDFTALTPKDMGILKFELTGFDSSKSYTMELFSKNKNLVTSFFITAQETFTQALNNFPPGTYNVKIIEDLNGNGRWDPGNYDKKLQPERIFTKDLEELRANWELDVKFSPTFN